MQNCQINHSLFAWELQQMVDIGKPASEFLPGFNHSCCISPTSVHFFLLRPSTLQGFEAIACSALYLRTSALYKGLKGKRAKRY
jgi:hypothetical protein